MHCRFIAALVALFIVAVLPAAPINAAEPSSASESTQTNEWQPLFNGKDLSGWKVVLTPDLKGIQPERVFQVHDGVIHVYRDVPQGVKVPIGFLASDGSYSWYHLKLEYRWGEKRFAPRVARPRDAGILYHAGAQNKVWPLSIECQIQEGDVGDCYLVRGAQVETTVDPRLLKSDEHHYLSAERGGVAEVRGGPDILRIVKSSTHEIDGWNTVEVILRGDQEVIHKINGHEVFRATSLKQLSSDRKTWSPLASGRILLQGEYAEVQYRNIQIKPLAGGPFRVASGASLTNAKPRDVASAKVQPAPIQPAANGVFSLPAQAATLAGKSVRRNVQTGALERWLSKKDRANWQVKNPKMGNYDVAVTWNVADEDAPEGYNLQVDDKATIRALTVSTGGEFKREVVGRILLAPGVHDVTFFPTKDNSRGGLCKLKRIELVPVANLATSVPQEPVELHVPEGFEVEHVAGPPLTSHPMLACFDDRGRLYVAESTGVNADASVLAESPPHEIRILEDTDGDGRFDKSTVFAEKLTFPQGIAWHDGAVYASSPPNFWRLTDTNGDDVADTREVLATGFPFRGMSDDMHGASLGPDGRMYFAAGRFPHKIKRPNGPVIHSGHNPLIVRCRPDGSELEAFCGAMGNAVGVAFTDAGDCFASGTFGVNADGKRDVLNHCVEGGAYPVLGQQVVEHKMTGGEMPNLTQFGASASSDLMIYRGETFGPEYRGNPFSALFNLHKIARHILEPDGATYRCHNEDFLTSPNPDFHPTDVLEDADGSLIVVDTGAWFLIGCPTSVIAKPHISGGIYRIRRAGAKSVTDPRGAKIAWESLKPGAIAKLLDDDRFAVRDRAMRELALKKDAAVPALDTALNGKSPPLVRLNAVWTLARIGSPDAAAAARAALTDTDDGVRQAAATAAGLFRDREATAILMEIIGSDKTSPVRREAASSLGRIGDKRAVPALLAALAGVTDRFLDHALIFALIRLDDREQSVAGLDDPSPEVRRGALIALDQMDHGNLSQDDVTRALETDNSRVQQAALEIISRHSGWANQITQLSTQWLADPDLSEDRRSALRGVLLAFVEDRSIQELIAQSLAGEKTPQWTKLLLLDVINRSELGTAPSAWQAPLLAALQSDNADMARAAVTAIAATNQSLDGQNVLGEAELLALARNDKQPQDLRVAAIAAAVRAEQAIPPDIFETLALQCHPSNEPVTRLQAASVIGSAKLDARQLDQVVDLIAAAGPLETPALMRAIENSDVVPICHKLVESLEKSPGISALPADRLVKLLEKLPTNVRNQADSLLKRNNVDLEGQRQRLEELKGALVGGDPERGRLLFFGTKASCSACHRVGDEGSNIGPNLAGIGEIRSRRDLLEAVAFPSASFARNFEPYTVLNNSGIAQSGVILRTTSDAIYLTTGERTTVRIPRSEIEEDGIVPSRVSIMPQGLDRILQPAELTDLLAYLSSLRDRPGP